ncbi:MAG: hypothetical protein P8R46_01645 [Planctomycetota bacterium]|nr:hypothetical protein [Planctomycetota bacterium]
MRRLITFTLVFGVGASLLWYLESERRNSDSDRLTTRSVPRPTETSIPAFVPPSADDEDETSASESPAGPAAEVEDRPALLKGERVVTSGAQRTNLPPRRAGEPRIVLITTDMQPMDDQGTRYELTGVKVDSFVVDGGPRADEPRSSSIEAEKGYLELVAEDLGLEFDDDINVRLKGVVVQQLMNSPLAPLTLEAGRLDAKLALEELRSVGDDVVTFTSRDLRGTGRGLVGLGGIGSLSFEGGADVLVELGEERTARIQSREGGRLNIVASPATEEGGARLVRVRAEGGALLVFGDASGATADGESVSVEAGSVDVDIVLGGDSGVNQVLDARAAGGIELRRGRDLFRGQEGRIEFEGARPGLVTLRGEPSVNYVVQEAAGELRLQLSGAGPVTANLDRSRDTAGEASVEQFLFVGPGRLEAIDRGGVITFENEARGRGRTDRSVATVLLSGSVRAVSLEGELESESVLATYSEGLGVQLAAEGPSTVSARRENGLYQAEAREGLAARLEGERWFIDEARDLEIEVLGDEPHRLSADMVRDVDVARETLVASGGVRYESLWGAARSDTAALHGGGEVELTGTEGAPVVLELSPDGEALRDEAEDAAGIRTGTVSALSLTLTRDTFKASGQATAELKGTDGLWRLDSDQIAGFQESSDGAMGTPFRFEVVGVRELRLDSPLERSIFSADRISLDGVVLGQLGAEATLDRQATSEIRAEGGVRATVESLSVQGPLEVLAKWSMEAASATLTREGAAGEERAPFMLVAEGVSRGHYEGAGVSADLSATRVEVGGFVGSKEVVTEAQRDAALLGSSLVATGKVEALIKMNPSRPPIRTWGDRFELTDGQRGLLGAEAGRRVRVRGQLPESNEPYLLTARSVDFSRTTLEARKPILEIEASRPLMEFGGIRLSRISGEFLEATRESASLVGSVESPVLGTGQNREGQDVAIRARRIDFPLSGLSEFDPDAGAPNRTVGPDDPVPSEQDDDVELLGFELNLGDGRFLKGDRGEFDGDRLRLEGKPATLGMAGFEVSAEFIEVDLVDYLLHTGRGSIQARREGGAEPFSVDFAGIESQLVADEILVTINAPSLVAGADSARADFVALFLDRLRWKAKGDSAYRGVPEPAPLVVAAAPSSGRPNFLAELLFELQTREYGQYLRSLYIEGGFEVIRQDSRSATGDRLYLDLPRAAAWAEGFELSYPLETRGREVPLRIRTDRLESDEEGALVADGATMTTCSHERPHFVVRTREFSLSPREDGRWRFAARGNRIKFEGGFAMPLPSIGNVVLDEEFGVEGFEDEAGEVTPLSDIAIAQTARFGATLGAAFRFDVGGVGSWIGEHVGMNPDKIEGKWDTSASYLWDRGPLLGLGLSLREHEPGDDPGEDFRVDAFIGGIPDQGMDRGTVRVDESDRDTLRLFGYVRSRYPIVRGEWVDVAVASQTDPGVQSEFYENDYQRFDQRDTFVRWRKSFGADYLAAGAQKRINSFRSQKEELPSVFAYRGERAVADVGGLPLLYGGSFEAGYFRRREGVAKQDLFSDLPGGAQVGTGDRESGRADLLQRVSLPIRTGVGAIKATPFAEVRGTAWTESLDDDGEDPLRGAAVAGMELSTTLHKVTDSGYLHALAPRISASTDLWYEESGGDLIPFDRTEDPIDGDRYEAGVRALWQRPNTFETFDLDLRTTVLKDRAGDLDDQREVATLGRYITGYGSGEGMLGILHDARYDLENAETTYTKSTFAVRPSEELLFEFSYGQARAIGREELYETGGVGGRWLIDPKWEIEARYSRDLRGDEALLTEFVLRRFSHDFVLDMVFQDRAGEGGTSIGLSFKPLLGWTRSRLGLLDRR